MLYRKSVSRGLTLYGVWSLEAWSAVPGVGGSGLIVQLSKIADYSHSPYISYKENSVILRGQFVLMCYAMGGYIQMLVGSKKYNSLCLVFSVSLDSKPPQADSRQCFQRLCSFVCGSATHLVLQ